MAEQDIYGQKFGGNPIPLEKMAERLSHHPTRSEQEIFESHFTHDHFHRPSPVSPASSTSIVGLLQSNILPSFSLHATFSAAAYGLSRATDRVDGKDWLWPAGITANAWWSAIGDRVINESMTIPEAWSKLDYSQKLLLTGVSAWGLRLLYRIVTRSVKRKEDDHRYHALKKDPGFWNKAIYTMFIPEAVVQTIIGLPFTLSLNAPRASALACPALTNGSLFHFLGVFLFSTGFALETLADCQLEIHEKNKEPGILRTGVWSIVRHPNYLGDALIHASFPLLLLGGNLLHPLALAAPIANYLFLRFVGGDKENEEKRAERYKDIDPVKAAQFKEYQAEKNSFWPSVEELTNNWTLVVAAVGVGGVLVEQVVGRLIRG